MKKHMFPFSSFSMKDGSKIRFWKDKYPYFYNIVRHKGDTLAKVLETSSRNVTFIRDLVGPRLAYWNSFLQRLDFLHLLLGSNEFRWNLNENGKFSVDSMYGALIQNIDTIVNNRMIK
jgi:hypothetical protein